MLEFKKCAFLCAIALLCVALLGLSGCAATQEETSGENAARPGENFTGPGELTGEVTITFDYEKQSGHASNQFAVWVEDIDGNYIKTLYVTRWTANGGYKSRPDSISLWVERSGLDSWTKIAVDAVSGATPKSGTLSYNWDLTDTTGEIVPEGQYKFFVLGTLRWKNSVLYSGILDIGGEKTAVEALAEFVYEGAGNQAALTGDSPENNMITGVTVYLQ